MKKAIFIILCLSAITSVFPQETALQLFLSDSSMQHGTISVCIKDPSEQKTIFGYNQNLSLTPASVMKLVTTAAAIELLGPDYTFTTEIGYTGKLNSRSGRLNGDIIIIGGGDPVLGSNKFEEFYNGFPDGWITEIKKLGIRSIKGRVITDDSYYDYLPIPSKWVWEDAGNYYGAGVYGLSVFDNTYEIHFMTLSDSSSLHITGVVPEECEFEFSNWLVAAGTADQGYVFAAPYSTNGWLSGSIPVNTDDFYLKASIADPPRLMSRMFDKKLKEAGITVSGEPTTTRLMQTGVKESINPITSITSPHLKEIIETLNHQSVNMYAEHLVKEIGKVFRKSGSTAAGINVITDFLNSAGINNPGMFIEDGSGLSPFNAVNSEGIASLLVYMKYAGKYFEDYFNSLPEAGKEGTLNRYFRDPVFESRLSAKSGSMTRVRSYAGYLTTLSGKELVFSVIVNNFTGTSGAIVPFIEDILRETINTR